jgi:hypothetical protein
MSRKKRTSQALEKATRRVASLRSIDTHLDLGNDLTLDAYFTLIETMRAQENDYNTALSKLDQLYSEMLTTETKLSDMSEHMLLGVATKYGKSSVEYGMAGGVPKNQRRKGLRGETPAATDAQTTLVVSPNGSPNGSKNGKATVLAN